MNVFMIAPFALSGYQEAGRQPSGEIARVRFFERRCLRSTASEQVPAVVAAAFPQVAAARLAAAAGAVVAAEQPTCTPTVSPD